jgi:hypothetical protein
MELIHMGAILLIIIIKLIFIYNMLRNKIKVNDLENKEINNTDTFIDTFMIIATCYLSKYYYSSEILAQLSILYFIVTFFQYYLMVVQEKRIYRR